MDPQTRKLIRLLFNSYLRTWFAGSVLGLLSIIFAIALIIAADSAGLFFDYPEVGDVLSTEVGQSTGSAIDFYDVVSITDGDTIKVNMDNETVILRLIGIDTPELHHPTEPVGCFAQEAKDFAVKKLLGKKVGLEVDDTQDNVDKYGRLLRYVILEDGTNFNLEVIERGFGYEYTYRDPYKYQSEFKAAQQSAKTQRIGLWGEACS